MSDNHQRPICHNQDSEADLLGEVSEPTVPLAGMTMTYIAGGLFKTNQNSNKKHLNANTEPRSAACENGAMAHFKIVDVLGVGGMGVVYRAEDLTLGRSVAIKLISAQRNVSCGETLSLLDEARLACKLNHPNIVTIYDVARGDGEEQLKQNNFIVMEWVEGQSLDKLIPEQGLSQMKVLEYACQIADGLVCAHEHQIIHGDIKPQNLMVSPDNKIKILDFGIACLRQKSQSVAHLTDNSEKEQSASSSRFIGTPKYMAPEQIRAGVIDERTDIFTFGLVVYEMLTGKPLFVGSSVEAIHRSVLAGKYHAVNKLCIEVSPQLASILDKMLSVKPEDRWQSASELQSELRNLYGKLNARKNWWQRSHWLVKVAVITPFLLLLGEALKSVAFPPTTQELVQRQLTEASKIALLPFYNTSGDPLLQIFVDGLSISLNSALTVAGFEQGDGNTWIIPSSEIRKLKDVSAKSVYNKFGVELVITGSVQHFGSTRSVVVNLLNASDGRQLKTTQVSIDANQLFEGEHAVRDAVLQLLNWSISQQTHDIFAAQQPRFDGAYRHFIEGRGYLYRHDQPGYIESAIQSLRQAILLDASYEQAWVELSHAFYRRYLFTKDVAWLDEVINILEYLKSIEPAHNEVDLLAAKVLIARGDIESASELYLKIISQYPDSIESYLGLAASYKKLNRVDDAKAIYEKAVKVSPNSILPVSDLGLFYFERGEYYHAIEQFNKLSKIAPNNHWSYLNLAACFYVIGDIENAISHTERAIQLNPTADSYSNLGTMYFYIQDYNSAVKAYEKSVELNDSYYIYLGNLADAYQYSDKVDAKNTYLKAIELAKKVINYNPTDTMAIAHLAYYYANIGETVDVVSHGAKIGEQQSGIENFVVASAYAKINMNDEAINHVRIALNKSYPAEEIDNTPLLNNIRSDKRFQSIIKKNKSSQ